MLLPNSQPAVSFSKESADIETFSLKMHITHTHACQKFKRKLLHGQLALGVCARDDYQLLSHHILAQDL